MIRDARLPQDEPAILAFINGLQDYEAGFEPNRRLDPNFAADHWREDLVYQVAAAYEDDDTLKRLTIEVFAGGLASDDTKEGLTAFIEKRTPNE